MLSTDSRQKNRILFDAIRGEGVNRRGVCGEIEIDKSVRKSCTKIKVWPRCIDEFGDGFERRKISKRRVHNARWQGAEWVS